MFACLLKHVLLLNLLFICYILGNYSLIILTLKLGLICICFLDVLIFVLQKSAIRVFFSIHGLNATLRFLMTWPRADYRPCTNTFEAIVVRSSKPPPTIVFGEDLHLKNPAWCRRLYACGVSSHISPWSRTSARCHHAL